MDGVSVIGCSLAALVRCAVIVVCMMLYLSFIKLPHLSLSVSLPPTPTHVYISVILLAGVMSGRAVVRIAYRAARAEAHRQ